MLNQNITLMAKLYSKQTPKNNINLGPKEETVNFLLNYSKALNIIKSKSLKCELLLN